MVTAVELLPGRGVVESEVRAAVDHDHRACRASPRRAASLAGLAVREGEEHDVVTGERVEAGLLEHLVGQRQEVRLSAPVRWPALECSRQRRSRRPGGRADGASARLRRTAAGAGDCDPCPRHVHDYTAERMFICSQGLPRAIRGPPPLGCSMARLDYPTTSATCAASRDGSATCSPAAPPTPASPAAPSGPPPTCCGTSPRSSGSGARSSAPGRSARRRRRGAGAAEVVRRPPRGLRHVLRGADRGTGGGRPGRAGRAWSTEQTVGFPFRRQAAEALIHRLDAEQTADRVTLLDPELAADGVDEFDRTAASPAVGRVRPAPPLRPGRA